MTRMVRMTKMTGMTRMTGITRMTRMIGIKITRMNWGDYDD